MFAVPQARCDEGLNSGRAGGCPSPPTKATPSCWRESTAPPPELRGQGSQTNGKQVKTDSGSRIKMLPVAFGEIRQEACRCIDYI